jgi:hypothetical protein
MNYTGEEAMSENQSFESYAIIELFGHNVIAGDVPPVDGCPGYTKFFGGAAIYAITPTDEETAQMAAERLRIRPVETWVVPSPKELPAEITQDDEWE